MICKEYFGPQGEPSYPILDAKNQDLMKKYIKETAKLKDVFFAGRLACFKYLNMDQTVAQALETFSNQILPAFSADRSQVRQAGGEYSVRWI